MGAEVVSSSGLLENPPPMREVIRTALVALPPERLFALITDIEAYPQFVPGCLLARIESSDQGPEFTTITATLGVRRGALSSQFTTRNRLEPHHSVTMTLVSGPFKSLEGVWILTPVGEAGCSVTLTMRFEFANRLTGALLSPVFEETVGTLVDAFVLRARTIKSSEAVLLSCSFATALPSWQGEISLSLSKETSVADVLIAARALIQAESSAAGQAPEWESGVTGIFGEVCSRGQRVKNGDRVELYQPLKVDPKQARRSRGQAALKARQSSRSG